MNIRLVTFIAGKMTKMVLLLAVIAVVTFALISASPLDPIQAYVGADAAVVSPEQRAKIAEYWGLNDSKFQQFVKWSSAVVQGDLGTSMIHRKPVVDVILERFKVSIVLMMVAWVLSGVVGFGLGVIAAMKQRTWIDRVIKWYCLMMASTPVFWLGLILLMVFAGWLGWFPIGLGVPAGVLAEDVTLADRISHLILPAITLSVINISPITLHTREKLIEVLKSDYVLFAKARGERGVGLLTRHGLRNIALPAITLQFASFSELFGGSVLAEMVFSYPGLGQATTEAGTRGDLPLLLGIALFSALFVFTGNLIADIIYRIVDPRTKASEGRT